jgi:hypothetical protein
MLWRMLSAQVPTAGLPRTPPQRHVAGLLAGVILVGGAAGLIGAEAFAVSVSAGKTYLELGAHGRYASDRYGLATDGTDWLKQPLGSAGSVRLGVASQHHKPIFLGVARPDEITRSLSSTGYTTFAEHTRRGVTRTDHEGPAPVAPMTRAHWTANAQGTGTQTVRWKATDGPRAVFAMQVDGSRPVRASVVSSAATLGRMPWWVPACALILAVALLHRGVVVLRRAIRVRRSTSEELR